MRDVFEIENERSDGSYIPGGICRSYFVVDESGPNPPTPLFQVERLIGGEGVWPVREGSLEKRKDLIEICFNQNRTTLRKRSSKLF